MKQAIDDPDLDVTADHVLILRNAGPQGGPGMPEWGMLPIPTKLVKQGVRDMVRLSDARMSGTSYGACILHVAPESYIGGPLALVRNGDRITLDVAARTHQSRSTGSGAGAAPRRMDSRPGRATSAAMAGCSRGISGRPTKAAISISWKPGLARRWKNRRFIEGVAISLRRRSGARRSLEPGTSRIPRRGGRSRVPRMLRSAPRFAAWCAADPGPICTMHRSRLCGAALCAAPRPGHANIAPFTASPAGTACESGGCSRPKS